MQSRLRRETVESSSDQRGNTSCVATGRENQRVDVEEGGAEKGYDGKRESMSCQRESRGSFDGAGEGEVSEGGAAEVEVCSAGRMRYLVSRLVRCWWNSFS